MNLTPKTDECIRMLREAHIVLSPLFYKDNECFDKTNIINFQNRIKAMFDYRLMPFTVISMPDNIDKDTAKEDAKTNSILQNISDFDDFWYVMKTYLLVTSDDLKNEFWAVCPNYESIPKFLEIMNVKFEEVNHSYPYHKNMEKLKELYGYNELIKMGISMKDVDEIFCNIFFIEDKYFFIMHCIREIYKTFRKMVPQQTDAEIQGNRQIKQQANNGKQQSRIMDTHKLSKYFSDEFNGKGATGINRFGLLIGELKVDRTGREFAQIAFMCYDGKYMNSQRPNTFKEWYRIFCECVGCEMKKYNKSKVSNPNDKLKFQFHYL
jgi:hypothetical protein